ncbi:hypothetical protein C8Q80DRAFT_1271078 [Daedaleopsis nitida]|nr:hypothetical protein C8Q80DRAFT_1271078 [Daedaleopsis nitida]
MLHLPAETPQDPADAAVDIARSSGSLESNTSAGSSLSPPSLDTSHSTSSTTSAASSTNPSPCPSILLRSNSDITFPTSRSASASPNISFAPLPQTEPRKRNKSHQLGVAARSRLLRHRRMLRENGIDPNSVPYQYGPGSGVAGGEGYQDSFGPVEVREAEPGVDADEEAGTRHHRHRAAGDASEDPFVALGKLIKGAGRTLFKSISMRDMRSKEKEDTSKAAAEGPGDGEQGGPRRSGSLKEKPVRGSQNDAQDAAHKPEYDGERVPSLDGAAWEQEIAQDSWDQLLSDTLTASTAQSQDKGASQERLSLDVAAAGSRQSVVDDAGVAASEAGSPISEAYAQ